jgi:hypothetical protein
MAQLGWWSQCCIHPYTVLHAHCAGLYEALCAIGMTACTHFSMHALGLNWAWTNLHYAVHSMAHNDFELPLFGDGVIVGRNAIVFCHLGSYRKDGQIIVQQDNAKFGKDSIIGARCATLPGYDLPENGCLPPLQLGGAGL